MMADSVAAPVLYPHSVAARDRFVLDRRPPRPPHDPWSVQGLVIEDELADEGRVARTATVFLTGRECPWRCVMCDLWRHTTTDDTPRGAIPAQLAAARARLGREPVPVTQIKLYNAGSFFDPRAVPEADYASIAAELEEFAHVVVESHPALVGPRVDRWIEALAGRADRSDPPRLEVAMGLETAHPSALERLHKRMTVEQFATAARTLITRGVRVRTFLLLSPPFVPDDEQERWLLRSIDVAFDLGTSIVSLIPTRAGNGALDALSSAGSFRQPALDEVERSVDAAFARSSGRGRLFVDLWDLERFSSCSTCFDARRHRLHSMNLGQQILPPVMCECRRMGRVRPDAASRRV